MTLRCLIICTRIYRKQQLLPPSRHAAYNTFPECFILSTCYGSADEHANKTHCSWVRCRASIDAWVRPTTALKRIQHTLIVFISSKILRGSINYCLPTPVDDSLFPHWIFICLACSRHRHHWRENKSSINSVLFYEHRNPLYSARIVACFLVNLFVYIDGSRQSTYVWG